MTTGASQLGRVYLFVCARARRVRERDREKEKYIVRLKLGKCGTIVFYSEGPISVALGCLDGDFIAQVKKE